MHPSTRPITCLGHTFPRSSPQPRLASLLFCLDSSPRPIKADVLDSFGELFSVAPVARRSTAAGPLVLSLWSTLAAQLNDSQQGLPAYLQSHAPKRQPISSSSEKKNKIRIQEHYHMSRIVCRVAQPGVCCNAAPRLVSFCVATWQSRRNSSCMLLACSPCLTLVATYLAENTHSMYET